MQFDNSQNQAPGIDLLANSDPEPEALRPLLYINDSVLVNRVCYPPRFRLLVRGRRQWAAVGGSGWVLAG